LINLFFIIDCYREGMNRIKFNDHFAAIRCILMILIISISTPLRAEEPACPEPPREAFMAIDQVWPDQVVSIRWHEKNDEDWLDVVIWRDRPFLWNQYDLTGITCSAVRKVWNPDCSFAVYVNAPGWRKSIQNGCSKLSSPANQ
jgi:hypothetical protein